MNAAVRGKKPNLTHDTVPASVGLVKEIRDELRADIRAVEHGLSAKIEQVMVSVHRTQVVMEEQRGENRIVLDGIKTLMERQDRIETDCGELRNTVRTLSTIAKR
ncbi:MAG: hypothetical protein HY537_04990 [Deltaproteobacteria bacterium]|nr:hypothetical protein [Deltaproteobacteria bacterium]